MTTQKLETVAPDGPVADGVPGTTRRQRVQQISGWVGATVVGLAGVFYLFHSWLLDGRMFGDLADPRMAVHTIAHWSHVARFGGWNELGYFYPQHGVLGYSDTFFIQGVLAAPLLWAGVNMFNAVMSVLLLSSVVGYATTLRLLRRHAGAPWPLAIVGAALFAFGGPLFNVRTHYQLYTIHFVPLVLLLLVRALARDTGRWRRQVFAAAAGFLLFAIVYSAFYVGWLTALTLGLVFVAWLVIVLIAGPGAGSAGRWREISRVVSLLPGAVLGAVWPVALLVWTYLSMLKASRGYSFLTVLSYALSPEQLWKVSDDNPMWVAISSATGWNMLQGATNVAEGMLTPGPILLTLGATLLLGCWPMIRSMDSWARVGLATLTAGMIMWPLPMQQGSFNLWRFVFWVPGANALRAILRIEIFSTIALGIGAVLVVAWLLRMTSPGWLRVLSWGVALTVLLGVAAEQYHTRDISPVPVAEENWVLTVPRPPADCTSFVVLGSRWETVGAVGPVLQIDAMMLSERWGLPTWNGYTSTQPDDWSPTFQGLNLSEAAAWKEARGISGGCGLRLDTNKWYVGKAFDRLLSWGLTHPEYLGSTSAV